MIVATASDKGSPGATTLATALGLVWPGERAVIEMDPAGADLPFRLRLASGVGTMLAPEPSVLTLAADARTGATGEVSRYAQHTSVGVPVVPGALSPEAYTPMARLWPQLAEAAAGWQGTVLADLGRLQPGNPAIAVAQAATAVLLTARWSLEGLYHLRDRVGELAGALGARERTPLAVVVVCPIRDEHQALAQVRDMLGAIGSPVPVAGVLAEDNAGARALWAGEPTRRLSGSDLLRSARALAETLIGSWPELVAAPTPSGALLGGPVAVSR